MLAAFPSAFASRVLREVFDLLVIMTGSATTRCGGVKHLLPHFPLPLPAEFLRQWTKPLFVNQFTPLQRWGQKQQCLLNVGSQPDKVQHLSYAGLGNMRALRQFVATLQVHPDQAHQRNESQGPSGVRFAAEPGREPAGRIATVHASRTYG